MLSLRAVAYGVPAAAPFATREETLSRGADLGQDAAVDASVERRPVRRRGITSDPLTDSFGGPAPGFGFGDGTHGNKPLGRCGIEDQADASILEPAGRDQAVDQVPGQHSAQTVLFDLATASATSE